MEKSAGAARCGAHDRQECLSHIRCGGAETDAAGVPYAISRNSRSYASVTASQLNLSAARCRARAR